MTDTREADAPLASCIIDVHESQAGSGPGACLQFSPTSVPGAWRIEVFQQDEDGNVEAPWPEGTARIVFGKWKGAPAVFQRIEGEGEGDDVGYVIMELDDGDEGADEEPEVPAGALQRHEAEEEFTGEEFMEVRRFYFRSGLRGLWRLLCDLWRLRV